MFAIHDCGFIERIALEEAGTGQPRIDKIREIIATSRFSIHDLSRVERLPRAPLPRLNMAFECGLSLGARFFGAARDRTKDLLVLDSKPHQYKQTMSDIAGQDGAAHDNDPHKAIACVRSFLAHKSKRTNVPGEAYIVARYKLFRGDLPAMAKEARLSSRELTKLEYFPELLRLMSRWQRAKQSSR